MFSGIGGFALAFEAAGAETLAFAEVDPFASRVLAHHWPDVPNLGDVREIRGDDVVRRFGAIDVLCGGFPCQDISAAGNGAGINGGRSGLWFEMLRLVQEVRPDWVLAENVPALRTRGADVVLAGLEDAGYTARAFVVGAWEVGAPHRRDRVWIVAHPDGKRLEIERRSGLLDGEWSPSGHNAHRRHLWPARPGEPQHEWEPPRVTQPRLGRDADGIPRRVDRRAGRKRRERLKALGNSIVPQVAAPLARFIVGQIAGEIQLDRTARGV